MATLMPIQLHYPEYYDARQKVLGQSLDDDMRLIDNLFGRGELVYGVSEEDVKTEALRQLEIEFRTGATWP